VKTFRSARRLLVVSFVLVVASLPIMQPALPVLAIGPDPGGTIYVADYTAHAIDVFAPGSNGNVAPIRRITGLATGVDGPRRCGCRCSR
jgi:hypothetical protein